MRKFSIMGVLALLIVVLCCGGVMASPNNPVSFTDVKSSNSKLVYINYLTAKGIISGFPDGTFKPLEGLTRAEAATIIVKAKNLPLILDQASIFSDVDSSHWANKYIATAQAAGLLNGFPDNTFRPEQNLTRAEAVSLLLRLSDEINTEAPLQNLDDVDNTHWAIDAINNSLVSGMTTLEGSNFFPDISMTREDLAQALAVLMITAPDLYKTNLNPTLKVINGTVKFISQGDSEPRIIEKEITLKIRDKIITTNKGEAEIIFPDGSGFLIKPSTEITLTESQGRAYIRENGQIGNAVDNVVVKLDVGDIFGAFVTTNVISPISDNLASLDDKFGLMAVNKSQKALPWYQQSQAKKVKVKVDMPWGVAAVRGTLLCASVDPDGRTVMSVLSGLVDLMSGGQSIIVPPGSNSSINSPYIPPSPPVPMPPEMSWQWQQEQNRNWLLQRAEDMENQRPAPPPTPSLPGQPPTPPAVSNNLEALRNALDQLRNNLTPPPTPSRESGGSSGSTRPSEPTTPVSEPLIPSLVGINHTNVDNDPKEIIWAIAVGELQGGDIVKVYSNPTDTNPLLTSSPVPSGGDRLIFPIIKLETTEGKLWLTRTSTNKLESRRIELTYRTFDEPAEWGQAQVEVNNNPGANDEVKVTGLQQEDRIIVYIEGNIYISDPPDAEGIATISDLNLKESGGYIGIRLSRPGTYLSEMFHRDYPPEEEISESVVSISFPEDGSRINELNEIKFNSYVKLNSDKAKVAVIMEYGDGGFGFLKQDEEQDWGFGEDEYWLDLQCYEIYEDEWSIEFNLPMDMFYTNNEYAILLEINTGDSAIRTTSSFTYDNEPPKLALARPFDPSSSEEGLLPDVSLKMYFIEHVEKVAGKNIRIWEDNDSVNEPFAIIDAEDVDIEDNFWQESTVTINIPENLESERIYYIEVDKGALIDEAGNEFEGISGKDTWYFTTIGW